MTTISGKNYYHLSREVNFRVKDKWSALTHFWGFLAAIAAMPVLLIRASQTGSTMGEMISYAVYMLSMVVLYGASTAYHSFDIGETPNRILKKFDHMSIAVLIAGTYTPICIVALKGSTGTLLLTLIWTLALAAMIFKLFWVTCPKWVSSVIYLMMGWLCIAFMPQILAALPAGAFWWLLAGGIMYTVGSVFYALKPKLTSNPEFGNHEIFHCFVLAGSFCHFIVMFQYLCMLG